MFGRKSPIEKLMNDWSGYKTLVTTRLGAPDVHAGEERKFSELKGRIAEGLSAFGAIHLSPSLMQEAGAHQRAMGDLLNRYPTLLVDQPLEERSREEFERAWHAHWLFMNRVKGAKEDAPSGGARVGQPAMAGAGGRVGASAVPTTVNRKHRSFGAWLAGFLFKLAILGLLIYAAVVFLPWRQLSNNAEAGGVMAFLSGAWGTIKAALGGIDFSGVEALFKPLVDVYGPEATTIMVALLLLAVGYLLIIRMK